MYTSAAAAAAAAAASATAATSAAAAATATTTATSSTANLHFFFYFPIAIPVSGWNVSIFHHSPNVLTLQWTSLDRVYNHHAEFYIVEVKSIQGTILTAETVYQNATSAIIKGLWPSTLYLVGVFGVDSTGQPYKSSETITSTKEGR